MDGKTALITGATSGIGSVILEHLASAGYSVIVFGRDQEKMKNLERQLSKKYSECHLTCIECDLSSMKSVQRACDTVVKSFARIDLLVLNAGIWNFKFIETEDGIEDTLQVNLITPILIFNRLRDLIPTSGKSKVIFTSSGLHQGTINFDDLEFRKNFSGFKSYRQSKLGLILCGRWYAKKFPEISFYTVHPGMVNTNLGRNAGWLSRCIFKLMGKSKEKGAQTHTFLITENPENLISGTYYANQKSTKTTPASYDMETAEKLLERINNFIDRSAY